MWLYHLIITPIEYIIEIVFTIMYRFWGHPGWGIIAVSIAISTLTLPLYLKADAIQHKEREKQKQMSKWMKHLRKYYSGDEYFMMINAYYKEQKYNPIYAVKGSLSLLLQIPFFIAAYHFLSNLNLLDNCTFGMISDLGTEDGLIKIGNNAINFLPILMTCINLVSVTIYTSGFSIKNKIQPVLLALIFLVLLYHSPSGLVLYWTMNNIYSLIKNVVSEKSKSPKRIIYFILSAFFILYTVYIFQSGKVIGSLQSHDFESLIVYSIGSFILFPPLISKIIIISNNRTVTNTKKTNKTILIESGILFALFGLMLPLSVLSSSPDEFLVADKGMSPWHYILFTSIVAFGLFFIWLEIYYKMSNQKIQFERIVFSIIPILLFNTFFYKAPIGMISIMLEFDNTPHYSRNIKLINLLLIVIFLFFFYTIRNKISKLCDGLLIVILLTIITVSGIYAYRMTNGLSNTQSVSTEQNKTDLTFTLSKNGKNVVILFLDRADGATIPFLLDEKPQLITAFRGFTFYPNTVAFGRCTYYGAPPLCGGYDYTPEEMNKRGDEYLVDKHNESLKMLPILFSDNGFEVTATDLPHGNYSAFNDMSIFEDHPKIKALTLIGSLPAGYDMDDYLNKRERNLFFYGFYKASPAMLQDDIYDTGAYLAADRAYVIGSQGFRDAYTALENLSNLTHISDSNENTFLMMYNNTPHEPTLLTYPNYDVSQIPDYTGIDIAADKTVGDHILHFNRDNLEINVGHYHSYMATMLMLGNWFDYLRKEGIYDNTRIIIVSDHGNSQNWFDYTNIEDVENIECFNPILMVKDFASDGDFSIDYSFMTHADTPALAIDGLIDNPVNPFTGNKIDMSRKSNGVNVFFGEVPERDTNLKTWDEGDWYHVNDDIFDSKNWNKVN